MVPMNQYSLLTDTQFLMLFALREGIVLLLGIQLLGARKIRNQKGNSWMAAFFLFLALVLLNDNDFLREIGIRKRGGNTRFLGSRRRQSNFLEKTELKMAAFTKVCGVHAQLKLFSAHLQDP